MLLTDGIPYPRVYVPSEYWPYSSRVEADEILAERFGFLVLAPNTPPLRYWTRSVVPTGPVLSSHYTETALAETCVPTTVVRHYPLTEQLHQELLDFIQERRRVVDR